MSDRTLTVGIKADDNASPVFQKVGNSAKTMGQAIQDAGKGGSGLDHLLQQADKLAPQFNAAGKALTGFGVGITAAIGVSVNSFASLEKAMANVASIAPDMNIGEVTNQIRDLAVELGVMPTGLAEGLYDLISSGIDAADAMDVLKISATAAKAGLTDTATASRAITAVLNAYSLSADKAGDVSDVLFNIVNEGVVTFEGLANNLSNTIPLAASLGIGIEELGAAYKELTLQGFSAATAETGIASVMRAAINPTEELTAAVREYGYASVEALVQSEGLTGLLRVLEEASHGSSDALQDLLGSSEATTGALALLKGGVDEFAASSNDMFLAMQDGALTAEVAARQMDTVAGSMDRLQAASVVLSGVVGEAFAGFARAGIDVAADGVSLLTNAIQALPGPLQTAAAALTGLAGGAAVFAGSMLLLAPRIVETRKAMAELGGLRGIFGMLGGAISPLGIALVALAGGALLVYENMRRGAEGAKNYQASVKDLTKAIEELKLAGDFSRATALEGLKSQVDVSVNMLDELIDKADEADLSLAEFLNFDDVDPTQFSTMLAGDFNRAIALADDVNARIGDALSNPNIDTDKYTAEVQRLLNTITITAEGSNIDEVMQQILDIDLTKFRDGVGEVKTGLQQMGDAAKGGVSSLIDQLHAGEEMLAKLADRTTEFSTSLDDLRIDGELGLVKQLQDLDTLFQENEASSDAYLAAQDRIFDKVADGTVNFEAVRAEVERLNAEYARTGDQEAYEAGMIALSLSLSDYVAGSQATQEKTAELTKEFTDAAMAIAGWDNALSQLNMTGMTGELGLFAEEGIRAGQAFDNTFRILVTNVQQYGQGIQQATDWMEGLVAVNEEGWSVVNQLAAEERITYEQRDAAVSAYNQTLEANYDIQQNLLAVQAMQAPYIAESVAATQAWVQELAQMPPEVQRTALAFADLQTVQQAQEIITLGNSDAFKAMGDNGVAAFTQVIQGALQTNPLLFNVLETMGIINGTPLDFTVNMDALEEAGGAMDRLIENIGNLVDTLREIYNLEPIKPEVDTSDVDAAQQQLNSLRDITRDPTGWAVKIAVEPELVQPGTSSPFGPGTFAGDYAAGWRQAFGIPDQVDVPVDVNVIPTIASASSTAGGALADLRSMLGIPPEITTLITATVSGGDQIESVSDAIDDLPDSKAVDVSVNMDASAIGDVMTLIDTINTAGAATMTVDVVIGTNELDTGLADWGLGTGGGGGGAARFDRKTVTIDVMADVSQAAEQIAGLMLAVNISDVTTIRVEADASEAIAQLEGVADAATAANDLSVSISAVTPGAEDSSSKLEYLAGRAAAADALSVDIPVATPGSGESIDQLVGVAGAAAAADAMTVNIPVSVSGAGAAVNALLSVAQAAASVPSSVSTTITTNRVTNNVQTYSTVGIRAQHGGIPGYASGGVVFRAAENNRPEVAHFATGGTATLASDGFYAAPLATYISPSNSTGGGDGDITITIYHQGGSDDDFDEMVDRKLIPAMEGAIMRRRRAYGLAVNA